MGQPIDGKVFLNTQMMARGTERLAHPSKWKTYTIQAAVLRSRGPLKIESLELEGPRDDEILVGIVASGICHTDISVIQGDAVPQRFIPKLIGLYQTGRFPFDRLVKFYDFKEINKAMADSKKGSTIKPVLRIGSVSNKEEFSETRS